MPIDINDNFNELPGQLFNYDTPLAYGTTIRNQILTNSHVDLRRFDSAALVQRRTQADLDGLTQAQLDGRTQSDIENIVISAGESWLVTGLGGNHGGSKIVGPLFPYNGWSGLEIFPTNTELVNLLISSSIPTSVAPGIDISQMDFISSVWPTFFDFDPVNSNLQLTSHSTGLFGQSGGWDSITIPFSHDIAPGPQEVRIPVSDFSGGTNFSLSSITGIAFTIVSNSVRNAFPTDPAITLLGLRAATNGWRPQTIDLNTLTGTMRSAPTLTGNDPTPAEAFVPLVRGEKWETTGGINDPKFIDGSLSMRFNCGDLQHGTALNMNNIDLIFREKRDTVANTGSWITARLQFYSGHSTVSSFKTNTVGTTKTVNPASINNYASGVPALSKNTGPGGDFGWHIFQATISNNTVTMKLFLSNPNGIIGKLIWDSTTALNGVNTAYSREQGRLGFFANLPDRDIDLDDFSSNAIAFSLIRTKPLESITPVIGAQLSATYATDTNLFQTFQGQLPDNGGLMIDTTKSYSNDFSYKSQLPIFSNVFYVEDWTQMYLTVPIWVPSNVTPQNQPYFALKSDDTLQTINLPKPPLQGNIWNLVTIDLAQLQGQLNGVTYSLYVQSGEGVKTPYAWYIDSSILLGRRNVSWQVRSNPGAPWREFRDSINDQFSGVHFPIEERGTSLQLQIVALTENAWVSSQFQLTPIYAQLGKPNYYNFPA